MNSIHLFFELLRVSIGVSDCLSHTPSDKEWDGLYDIAMKQSLVGICLAGIEKLKIQEQYPYLDLLMEWVGQAEYIKSKNILVNKECRELQLRLDDYGLTSCILKGQGVAQYYNDNLRLLRQSGDIDVWIKGGYDIVCNYIQNTIPSIEVAYHRFHYKLFEDTEVELHQHPSLMNNPFHNKIFQRWAEGFSKDSFVRLNDLNFYTPSTEFNKVFLLCHLYRHFVAEGVGLRQLIDYYFVLKNSAIDENEKVITVISQLGMTRFAKSVMWVMKELFCLDDSYLLITPDGKEGRYLLNEVLEGGNFGKYDERYDHTVRFALQRQNIRHSAHLVLHYPSEVLWSPFWLIWHFFWKKWKIRKIKVILSNNEANG